LNSTKAKSFQELTNAGATFKKVESGQNDLMDSRCTLGNEK